MKSRSRFEKLARGCFALTLSLTEWLELEELLVKSRTARLVFQQRSRVNKTGGRRLTSRPEIPFSFHNPWTVATKSE